MNCQLRWFGVYEAVEGLKEIRILGKESHFHKKVYEI